MNNCISYKQSLWFILAAITCSCGLTTVAAGAELVDPAAPVAPFVNNFTFGVIRIEVPGADFDATGRWADEMFQKLNLTEAERKEASQGLHEALAQLHTSADAFTKAGGKSLWLVLSIEQFPHAPGFVLVPLEPGADAGALKKLFAAHLPDQPDMVFQSHDALVVAMEPSTVEGWKKIQAQPRPELSKALAAAGNGRMQLALVPSDDSRRVLESMLPNLPGGQPTTALTRGIIWAATAIQLPPNLSAHAVIQSQDETAAQKLKDVLSQLKKPAEGDNPPGGAGSQVLLSAAIDAANHAQVKGDQVVIDLDQKQATNVAADLDVLVRKTRERASRMSSMNNIKQIILGCYMFGEKHNDKWPASLEELAKLPDLAAAPQLFTNPRNPDRKPGYVYLPPKDVAQIRDRAKHIVVYETFDKWDGGIGVGYADGHAQFIQNEAEFRKQLAEQAEK